MKATRGYWSDLFSLTLKLHHGESFEGVVIGSATGNDASHVDFNCNAHELDLVVDAAGNSVLCGQKTVGNIYLSGLEDVWHSNDANSFRADINKDQSPCIDCDYRKRCLRPSMSLLDNHFSEAITRVLDDKVRESIGFTRNISDTEAMDIFIKELSKTFRIFEIFETENGFEAHRSGSEQPIKAKKRHELQKLMIGENGSPLIPNLIEQGFHGYNLIGYMNKFWAAPQSLGKLNITMQSDRERPEILVAQSIDELRKTINENNSYMNAQVISVSPVLIEQGFHGYNLVGYMNKFYAAPLRIGHLDFTMKSDRERPEIIMADTIEEIRVLVIRKMREKPDCRL